jgi:hypothetical protein
MGFWCFSWLNLRWVCETMVFFFFFAGLVQGGALRLCSGVEALFFGFVWVEGHLRDA